MRRTEKGVITQITVGLWTAHGAEIKPNKHVNLISG